MPKEPDKGAADKREREVSFVHGRQLCSAQHYVCIPIFMLISKHRY